MDVFDLFARIGLDTSGYEQGLNQASQQTSKFGNMIKSGLAAAAKVTAAAVTTAAAGVAAITKSAVENYAQYEQLVGGVETLFKDSADVVQQYAANAYKTAGLSANEYMETVTSFSASLLQSLGGDTAAAAEVADKAITDMSDNANKMGTDMELIQNSYQGFAKQNFTMLDNLKLGYGGTKEEMQRLLDDANEYNRQQGINTDYQISNYADIVEAIHVVQTEMGITGTTAREAATTIEGSLASAKSAWSNLLTGIADENADFDTLINNFVDSASTAIGNLLPRIQKSLQGVGKLVSSLAPVIAKAIPDLVDTVLPSVLQAAVDLVTALVNALVSSGDTIANTALTILNMLVNAITQNAYTITNGAISIILSLINGISAALPQLVPAAIEIITQIVTAIMNNLPLVVEAGLTLFTSLVAALPDAIVQIVTVLPEIITSIIATLMDSLPLIIQAGIDLFVALVGALPEIIDTIVEAIPQIINGIYDAVLSAVPQIVDAGIQLFVALIQNLPEIIITIVGAIPQIITNIISALSNSIPQLVEAGVILFTALIENLPTIIMEIVKVVPQIVEGIIDSFNDFIPNMLDAGKNLISGIGDGLIDGLSNIKEKIKEAGTTIVNSFKDFFGIASPSKLFKNEVGKYLADGLGIGFEDEMSSVAKNMQNAVPTSFNASIQAIPDLSQMTTNYDTGLNSASSAQTEFLSSSGNMKFEINIENFNNYTNDDIDTLTDKIVNNLQDKINQRRVAFS